MKLEKYKCDRCDKQIDGNQSFWKIVTENKWTQITIMRPDNNLFTMITHELCPDCYEIFSNTMNEIMKK